MLTKLLEDKHIKNFHVYDVDNSGYVEQADLEGCAQNLAQIRGWEPGTTEFSQLMANFVEIWTNFWQSADIDGDGKVSIKEYLQVAEKSIQNFANSPNMQDAHAAKANAIFTVLDGDNDGTISLTEYEQFFSAIGLDQTMAKVAFEKLDEGGKGYLSRDEYLKRSEEFHIADSTDAPGNWLYGAI